MTDTDVLLFFTLLRSIALSRLPIGEGLARMAAEHGDGSELAAMAREVSDGERLSAALARRPRLFPAPLPALIAAGEQSGDLAAALAAAVVLARHRLRARAHLQAALLYPAICLLLALAIALVLPAARASSAGRSVSELGAVLESELTPGLAEPSLAGRLGLAASGMIEPLAALALALAGLALAAGALLVLALRYDLVPDWSERRDALLLHLPFLGRLYRTAAAASFARALGTLLERGLPVDQALAHAIPASGNRHVERALGRELAAVRDGNEPARSLALTGLLPPSFALRLAAGLERGQPGEAAIAAAASYETELELQSARLARLAEPAGLVVVGVVAILLVLATAGRFLVLERYVAMFNL